MHLLRALAGIEERGEDPDGTRRFTVFAAEREVPPEFMIRGWEFATTQLSTARPTARIIWEQLFAPISITRRGIDLFHASAYALPLLCPARSVVTVHDLSFFRFPHLFNRFNRVYLRTITRLSARRATRLIAVSEATARDIVDLLGVPRAKVAVVHNGVDGRFRPLPVAEVAAFRARRGLPEQFILHLGTLEPRKNLTTLVRAYARLRRMTARPPALVLAGGRGWLDEEIFRLVGELGLGESVHFPGYVEWEEQPLWYNAAAVFAYPSLYEGFGLPPLEALACGTPVVAARTSSLPEVVGDAGLLVAPTDDHALADALRTILTDAGSRDDLSERGIHQAARFRWTTAARKTLDVYDDAGR